MKKLSDTNLFVGDLNDSLNVDNNNWAIVHATQTIHYQLFGWNRTSNKPDKNHPNYIFYEKDNRLSLNWVDGKANLYEWSGNDKFIKILDFIDKWLPQRNVLVHCDQGFSRSPSLCLLYLAKRIKIISDESYQDAKTGFLRLYPEFSPGG
ncbi:dual specificity protein phosphatase family protein, partial [Bacteroidota bacterium]